MPQPVLSDKGSNYEFAWTEYQLTAHVSRIHEHKDGRISCELKFTTSNPEYKPHLLQQTFNLLGTSQGKTLLKNALGKVYKAKVDWDEVIEQICGITLNKMREGEPIEELWTDDSITPVEYKLYPILLDREPTLLFADGGSGKSSIGLYIASCITLPWNNNPLGFKPKFGKVLILDWETSNNTYKRNIQWLRRGHDLPEYMISYRRCWSPLADDINAIHEMVSANEIDTIIVDSIIGAVKGDVNDSTAAQDFFRALRRLNVTSLLIHHTAKKTDMRNKSPFGSAYFNNLPRSVWELTSYQEPGIDKLNIMMSHYKCNVDTKHPQIGIEVIFHKAEGRTVFRRINIENVAEFEIKLSLGKRILIALKHGPMTVIDLSDGLNEPQNKIRARLSNLNDTKYVAKLNDGRWCLPHVN